MKKPIGPNLKLTVTKGPSSGFHSTFPPRFKINIGRIVSGNKISIKDPGISSKHVLIHFDIGPGSGPDGSGGPGYWTITDLGSSNGTILNSKSLDSETPYALSDCDLIKFGEETIIRVQIEGKDEDFSESGVKDVAKGGRVTRRRAKLGVIEEEKELGLGFGEELGKKEKRVCRGGGKKSGNGENLEEIRGDDGEFGVIEGERELGFGVGEELGKKVCRGRVQKSGGVKNLDEIGGDGGELGVIEGERGLGKKAKRVCRGSFQKSGNDVIGEEDEDSELGVGVVAELGKDEKKFKGRVKKNENVEIGKEGLIEEESELGVGVDEELGKNGKVGRSRVQRNVKAEIGKEGVIEEDSELGVGVDGGLEKNEKKVGRGRAKKNENAEISKEGGGLENLGEDVDGGKMGVSEGERELGAGVVAELGKNGKKVGRGRAKKNGSIVIGKGGEGLENLGENEGRDVGIVSTGVKRVTRSSRRNLNVGAKNGEEMGDAGTGRVTRGRMTRSSRIEDMSEIRGYDDRGTENMGVVEKGRKKGPAKSQKRTRSTSIENCGLGKNVVEGGLVVNSEVVDRSRRNCTRVKKKLEVEVEAPESCENGQIREEEMGEKSYLQEEDSGEGKKNGDSDRVDSTQDEVCAEGKKNGEGDRVDSTQEKVCGDGLTDSPRTNLSVLARMEKMTLGEWLDYIEDYLPKQIVAETEEMITEMRLKAERFHDFMLQQTEAKGERGI